MNLDKWLLACVWVLSLGIIFTIPRHKIRLAVLAFLFKQMLTCPLGLIAVELDLLAYPVREFPDVNRSSLTYEYLVFPIVCMVFLSHFPSHRSWWQQLGYYIAFCTALTVPEIFIERYTNLITYLNWHWSYTWLSLMATFFIARIFSVWFFSSTNNKKSANGF